MTARRSGRRAQATVWQERPEASLILPAWRSLLESRWQQRVGTLTRLSLAYHEAAERSGGHHARGQAGTQQLRRLLQETVAARRALCDTEEALARLSAGHYGSCEQCDVDIPAAQLAREPEARYCERCFRQPTGNPGPARNLPRPGWTGAGPRPASPFEVASRNAPFGIQNEKFPV